MNKKSESIYSKTKFGINKFDFDSIENNANNKDEQSKIRYLIEELNKPVRSLS